MSRIFRGAAVLVASWLLASPSVRLPAAEPAATIHLAIDYGDGVEKHFNRLRHTTGITVLDAMKLAVKHPRGIRFQHRGRGATAFLTQIDNLKNEGRGRNWLYQVNGKLAESGFGVRTLKPGDRVRWTFKSHD